MRIPILSESAPFIKILPMGLLVIPIVIVGALVTLLEENRKMFWLSSPKPGDPGNLLVTESVSFGLFVLENNGKRLRNELVGLLAV